MPLDLANYLASIPSPADDAKKTIDFATGLAGIGSAAAQVRQRDDANAIQAGELALKAQEEQRKAARQLQMEADLDAFFANKTLDGAHNLMLRYGKELSGDFKPILDQLGDDKKQALISQTLPIYNALYREAPDVALSRGETIVAALENSGQKGDAKALRAKLDKIKDDPAMALAEFGGPLFAAMGKEAFEATFRPVELERRKLLAEVKDKENAAVKSGVEADVAKKTALREAEARIGASDASAGSSNAAREKTNLEIEDLKAGVLTGEPLKEANKAIRDARESHNLANTAAALSGQARRLLTKSGVFAKFEEAIKVKLGKEDAVTALRTQIQALLNSEVLKGLPQGAASEKEMEFAKSAVLDSTTEPEILAQALDRMTALHRTAASLSLARGKFMGGNRGSLATPSTRDFTINGVPGVGQIQVKKGMTFDQVEDAILGPPAQSAPAAAPVPGVPTPAQVQSARDYIAHKDADPAKVAALKEKYSAAGVTL